MDNSPERFNNALLTWCRLVCDTHTQASDLIKYLDRFCLQNIYTFMLMLIWERQWYIKCSLLQLYINVHQGFYLFNYCLIGKMLSKFALLSQKAHNHYDQPFVHNGQRNPLTVFTTSFTNCIMQNITHSIVFPLVCVHLNSLGMLCFCAKCAKRTWSWEQEWGCRSDPPLVVVPYCSATLPQH